MMNIIKKISLGDNEITIEMDNNSVVLEQNQDCCESRYFVCDNNLDYYRDSVYLGYEVKDHSYDSGDNDWDSHESATLEIKTSIGAFDIQCHNIHNGYYGGIYVTQKGQHIEVLHL